MKKILLSVLFATTAFGAWSQGVGVGPELASTGTNQTVGADSASESWTNYGVFVPIFLNETLEVTPRLGLIVHSQRDPANLDNAIAADQTDSAVYFGLGAYWTAVKGGLFSLKSGVSLTAAFNAPANQTNFDLVCPVIVDVETFPNLFLRLSHEVMAWKYQDVSTGSGATLNSSSSYTFKTFTTGFNPTFAVYYRFK